GRHLLHLARDARLRVRIGVGVPGVVDQHVELATRRPGELGEPATYGPRIGDVTDQRAAGQRRAQPGQLLVHGGGRRRPEVVDADPRPGAGEGEGDLTAEAGAAAGDERDLPVQVCQASPPDDLHTRHLRYHDRAVAGERRTLTARPERR